MSGLQRLQLTLQVGAHLLGVGDEVLTLDDLDVGQGDGAGDRVHAEGDAADQRVRGVALEGGGDLVGGEGRADGGVARGELLGDGHQVGLDGVALDREPLARAAEAVDHLVGDEHDVVLVAELTRTVVQYSSCGTQLPLDTWRWVRR